MRGTEVARPPSAAAGWTAGLAVGVCVAFPVFEIAAIGVGVARGALLPAVLAAVCYLPPFLWIVVAQVRGARPRGAWWMVGAIAAVLVVSASTVGAQSLAIFPALAVAAMLLVRPTRAPAVLLALVAATTPFALTLGGSADDFWYPTEVLWLYALVGLVAAVRRLELAHRELADQALLRERLRIDDELRATVGVALADLADQGDRLTSSPGVDDPPAELVELVAAARRSFAQARRIVRGYQQPALHVELESAVALLAAAGISARVVGPHGELSAMAEQSVRRELRSATARLLRGGGAGRVVLCVAVERGTHRFTVRPDVAVGDGAVQAAR